MKKKLLLMLAGVMTALCVTGCVKVIDKGTEGQYTGETEFDAASNSGGDWEKVVAEITENAVELSEQAGKGLDKATAVSVSGEVKEFESKANGKKNSLILDVEGVDDLVKVQIGSIYSGTDIRDVQTVKNFESFTNQTEWSQYAKALNAEVDSKVVAPLSLDDSVVGKGVVIVGAANESGGEITITPVSITIE